jgi:hypothetical protein
MPGRLQGEAIHGAEWARLGEVPSLVRRRALCDGDAQLSQRPSGGVAN